MFIVKRNKKNPLIGPEKGHSSEGYATFNGNPIMVGSNINLLYRAQSLPEKVGNDIFSLSSISKAVSRDGINFTKREQFILPEEKWERFGCEDPRVTKIGSKYYIFYTALSIYPFTAQGIKVGLAISDDLKKVSEKHLVTPFNAKAMTLFPEKINGKYVAMLTVHPDLPPSNIALAEFDKIEDIWSEDYWNKWYKDLDKHILTIPKSGGDHVEIGSCPIKTKDGWLLVYSSIQNYLSSNKIFGIECLLLDLKNPLKIIGKTKGPILVPEEQYEIYGMVRNTIFPSGAMIKGKDLYIYYGSTDTTISLATVSLEPLIKSMKYPYKESGFKRLTKGPLIVPRKDVPWESKAIFNPACIEINGVISILYRAMSEDNTSVMGIALTKNGTKIIYQGDDPAYVPREYFEEKRIPGGNSGCEDPRLTQIGNTIYVYYTAYNGITPPSVAMSCISKKDFVDRKWNWSKPVLVTADGVDDKDGCLHPELIKGKYMLFHRVNNYICIDYGKTPAFTERNSFKNIPLLLPRKGMWDSKKVGISAPPIKTKKGWILLYHGVSENSVYRVGAALLDLKDPTIVISRTTDYIFSPLDEHDLTGQVNNVVFPCGAVLRNGKILMYYGGADSVVDVAEIKLEEILKILS